LPTVGRDGRCPYSEFYNAVKGGGTKNAQARVQAIVQKLREEGLNLLATTMMKRIEDNIYELRPGDYRILCYLDNDPQCFVLLNGFLKQSRRTPEAEKSRARRLAQAYVEQKGR
jgi:phage-related protein